MIHLTYRIETPGNIEAMAQKIASDQSTGTFVPVPGETEELKARVAAHVVSIKPLENAVIPTWPELEKGHARLRRADVEIAFPLDAVGTDLSALMTIAIGGVYSIKGMTGIRVVDMKTARCFSFCSSGPTIWNRRESSPVQCVQPSDYRHHRQAGTWTASGEKRQLW